MAPGRNASDRVWTDLAYVAISVVMMALGGGLFVFAIRAGQSEGALGFGPLHALGAVLVSLGVALFLYRVLNQRNVNKLMSVGGSAAGSLSMFGLLFVMEDRSVDFFNKAHPAPISAPAPAPLPPPPAPPQDAKLSIVAHLDNPNALDGNPAFHGREMRLQVTDPWAVTIFESPIGDTGWVAFNGYDADGDLEQISAELRPHALVPMKTEVYQHYAAQFCIRRHAASWSAVRQITLNCKLGGVCVPTVGETAIGACQADLKTAWAQPVLSLIATTAHAAPGQALEPPGWVVPDLEGACIAGQRLGETFYRFDVATQAPAKAATFHYSLSVNDRPIYVDGERDPRMRKPLAGGAAKLSFALQNLEFSGAAGPVGGQEKIALALQFYDPAGHDVGHKASDYLFVALRQPKPSGGDVRWNGAYVLGKAADGRELLINSPGSPNADMRPIKAQFDALRLVYSGTQGRLNGRFPVVAVVRPFLAKEDKPEPGAKDGMPGLNLGLVTPDGRVRFTFTDAELKGLMAWYNAERRNHPLTRSWSDGYAYGLRGYGTVTPKAAGCPTLPTA